MVIIGDQLGVVRAYTEGGVLRWSHDANRYNPSCPDGAKITGAVAVANGLVYASVGDRGVFLALDLRDGRLVWKFQLPEVCGDFTTSPAVAHDKVFVAAKTQGEAKMYALPSMDPNGDGVITDNANPQLSELVWTFTLPEFDDPSRKLIGSTPAVHGDAVFFGADDGRLWALPVNDPNGDKIITVTPPNEEWSWPAYKTWKAHDPTADRGPNDRVKSSPAIHDFIYVGARRSLLALGPATGSLMWKYIIPLGSQNPVNDIPVESSPSVAAALTTRGVYFAAVEHLDALPYTPYTFLYALNENDLDRDGNGDLRWKRVISEQVQSRSSPAIFDGLVFIGSWPFTGNDWHVWAIKDP